MNEIAEPLRLPPLHAPDDRELLAHVGTWQVRRHALHDERFAYCASRAFLHVQLWRPDRQISILTPSRLTNGRFEIARGWRRASVSTWPGVVALLPDHELPSGSELAALTMWLVVRSEVVARRSSGIDPDTRPFSRFEDTTKETHS